jgi:hypothetical protein
VIFCNVTLNKGSSLSLVSPLRLMDESAKCFAAVLIWKLRKDKGLHLKNPAQGGRA